MEAAFEAAAREGGILAEIASKGDFPAAAQAIERLQRVARKEDCTALSLAQVILQDAGLSAKVLRVINSAFYHTRGVAVSTITRAVILLGFDRICELATGLLLLDQFVKQGRGSAVLRENLRRSLRCGVLAHALSERLGSGIPEEAYLLGLFSNLGVLWLATYYPERLEAALALEREGAAGSLEEAIARSAGASPAEIAAQVLEQWSLPPGYKNHFLRQAARERDPEHSAPDRLSAIVELADAYARDAERNAEPSPALLARMEKHLSLTPDQASALFERAEDEVRDQIKVLGLEPPPAAAVSAAPAGRPAGTARTALRPAAPEPPASSATGALALAIVAEVTQSILVREDINNVLGAILEGIARSGGFDGVVLALLTPQRDRLVGRLGYGEGVQQQLGKLSVPIAAGAGLLAEVIAERRPRVVPSSSVRQLVPAGAPVPELEFSSFLIEPLVVRDRAVGAIVAARRAEGSVTDADRPLVQTFANLAGIALAEIGQRGAPA